jgi:hypothetical protein
MARLFLLLLLVALQAGAQLRAWEAGSAMAESALGSDGADELDDGDALVFELSEPVELLHRDAPLAGDAASPEEPHRALAERPPNA